jgi:hypothetical protein
VATNNAGPFTGQQRLKGQEIQFRILQDTELLDAVTAFGAFNEKMELEMKQDGFIGETTDRYDDVFKGWKVDISKMHIFSTDFAALQAAIESRARRITPGTIFNAVRTDTFADGSTLVITYQNLVFGEMPTDVGGRTEFVTVSFSMGCSERDVAFEGI